MRPRETRLYVCGSRLQISRAAADLSVRRAAQTLGISPTALLNYEAGKREPPAFVLLDAAELYGRDPAWLGGSPRHQ